MICEICGRPAEHRHHKYAQYKRRRKLYGELIHHPKNIQYLCAYCHLNEKKGIKRLSEKIFCNMLGIKTISKSGYA
jgi:uncharacterized protein YlbG (UPF0298 family)